MIYNFNMCGYGCGRIAIKQFKNGKWCCANTKSGCPVIRNKISKKLEKHPVTIETRNKISDFNTGATAWNKGLTKETDSRVNKISLALIGNHPNNETRNKMGISNKKSRKDPNSYWNSKEYDNFKEAQSQRLKNGQAAYMNKFIKNPSDLEIEMRKIVLELYPTADPQHTILNYSVDIAIIEYKIAIEHDGEYHFKSVVTREPTEYHSIRQKRIEDEGWIFIRYSYFDEFPTKDQLKEDILKIINKRNKES